jgi:hypothetical protein
LKSFFGRMSNDDQSMIREQDRGPIMDEIGGCLSERHRSRRMIGGDEHVSADVELELLEDAGDRLVRDGEHRGVDGVGMDDGADLGMLAKAGEVKVDLGGGRAMPGNDFAGELGDDEVIELHLGVAQRGRREHHASVGCPRRDIASGARRESASVHLLQRFEHGASCRTPIQSLLPGIAHAEPSGRAGPLSSTVLPSGSIT